MAQFPTTKTVPLDKDIGVSDPKTQILGTPAREQLSVVLDTIDQAIKTEQTDRIADVDAEEARAEGVEANLQAQITAEVNRATAAEAAEAATRLAADNAEAATRSAADTNLQNEIDAERDILRMTASGKTVVISDVSAVRVPDGTKLSIANGSLIANFSGATVDFQTGQINAVANFTPIDFAGNAGKWAKYALVLLPGIPNTVLVIKGTSFGSSANSADAPAFDGGIPIGIVSVKDNGAGGIGTIDNILQTELIQFAASGSGNGSGSGEAGPLAAETDSNYEFYTPSDFSIQKNTYLLSTTGTDQILGLKKVILNSGQNFISKELTGPSFYADDSLLNYARAKLMYNVGKVDQVPTIQFSQDGGATWITAVTTYPSSGGNLVIGEIALPSASDVFTGGPYTVGGTGANAIVSSYAGGASPFTVTAIDRTNDGLRATANAVKFTVSGSSYKINYVNLKIEKTGAPTGSAKVTIVKSSGGSPSTNPVDVVATANLVALSTITSGTVVQFVFPGQETMIPGDYFVVLQGDPVFIADTNNTFANGKWFDMMRDVTSGTNNAWRQLSGSWSVLSNSTVVHEVDAFPVITGGAVISGGKIAVLFSPTYRTKVSNLKVAVATTATVGTINAKLYNASAGVPTTLISAGSENYVANIDITSSFQLKSWSLSSPQTLNVGSVYAIVVEGTGLNGVIQGITVDTPTTQNQSSATFSAGWTPAANKLAFAVSGTGADLRLKVISGTNASELTGFGVDYVLEVPGVNSTGLAFFDPKYDRIVGSAAQVASGVANYTTLSAAIAAANQGDKILVLRGTYTETVNVNKEVAIEGMGRGTVINGAVTISANYGEMRSLRFASSLTVTGIGQFVQGWQATGQTLTADEDQNHIRVFEE